MSARAPLDLLMAPRSVAVIGASDDGTRLSGRPVRYLLEGGYQGEILPINPTRATVQGLPAFPSLAALPAPPDAAIIGVGARMARAAVQECAAAGVKAAIMFAAGFAEMGAEGQAEQAEIVRLCRAAGMRLLGPNCIGLFNAHSRFFGTFSTSLERGFPRPGKVAIVAQSGAYAQHAAYLAARRGVGVGYMIATGNEADIGLGEALLWCAGRPDVELILACSEGVRDPALLVQAFELAQRAGKAVSFVKIGASEAGARAAATHTAALAGDDAVYDAVFRQFGVRRARSMEEQVDLAYAVAQARPPAGRRLGVLTLSGGFGIQICDAAARSGLDVAPMPAAAEARLRELLPFGATANPVDCTGQAVIDLHTLTGALDTLLAEGGYDTLCAYIGTSPLTKSLGERLRAAIVAGMARRGSRPVALCMSADPETIRAFEAEGLMIFEEPTRAVAALGALAAIGARRDADAPPAARPAPPPAPADLAGAASEHVAKRLLAAAGVPVLPERLAPDLDAALRAAAEFGYPVAMKIASPDIAHKTEVGGVALGLAGPAALAAAHAAMLARVAAAAPGAGIEGVLISPMARKGVETIIGVLRDPTFGPVVMFGLGGILVEVLRDVTFRRAPFDEAEAMRMIAEVKGHALLAGARGAARADIPALARTLAAVSRFAAAHAERIEGIDINPFVVWAEGEGGAALDALIMPRRDPAAPCH